MDNVQSIPQKLSVGDTVALINPAGPLPERFLKQEDYVIDYLHRLGLKVKNNIIHDNWRLPENRANALLDAFCDESVQAIFPICGGEAVYEVLPALDYAEIAKHPKIICGYSYISALLMAISEKSNMITFHAPHLNFLNDKSSKREVKYNIVNFWNTISHIQHAFKSMSDYERTFSVNPLSKDCSIPNIYANAERLKQMRRDNQYVSLSQDENVTGIVNIVSLEALVVLQKMGMARDFKEKLLFLDTLDSSFERIDANLSFLNKNSPLSDAAAVIFSSIYDRENPIPDAERRIRRFKFLNQIQKKYEIRNLLFGFPFGHCIYKLTMPMGEKATLSTKTGSITLIQPAFVHNANFFMPKTISNVR